MSEPDPDTAGDALVTPVANFRAFPVRWLAAGLMTLPVLIAIASTLTFIAQAKLQHVPWGQSRTLHEEVDWYLQASALIRVIALGIIISCGLAVRRGARRLDAARIAAEACADELRAQKKVLKALNERLFDEARIDPLTQLQTRLRLNEDLEKLWANSDRYGDHVCAVMCDVDRFKEYNDTYGHIAGDEVLRRVAGALLRGCRAGDRLYRYGGEEFLLVIRVTSMIEGLNIADRHRAAIEALAIDHDANTGGKITISMGLAPLWAGEHRSATDWIEQADAALYRAKRSGRNCIAAIGEPMPEAA